jgi:hypothetical protein
MSKKLTTLFPSFFPPLSWWQKMCAADVVVFLDSQPYSSRSKINRTWIKTVDGKKNLTVPVLRPEHHRTELREIKIDPLSNWWRTHKASLVSNYGNTPYFDDYFPHFERFYSRRWEQLIECNMAGIKLINRLFRWEVNFLFSSEIPTRGSREERVMELLERFDCDRYVVEADSEAYFRSENLKERKYLVDFIEPYTTEYAQQFSGFCHDLSVIDLIFNEGPYGVTLLRPVSDLKAKQDAQ